VADAARRLGTPPPGKRSDARRNEKTLLGVAAAAFVASGVDVPVRDIAAAAGVGVGTIYRHFPTRADLIVAVYRHQVEACADAGPALLSDSNSPHAALTDWINLFVDFLITKRGLAPRIPVGLRRVRDTARLLPRPPRPRLRPAARGRCRGG
jgi:AcrR family transcriptional regulator